MKGKAWLRIIGLTIIVTVLVQLMLLVVPAIRALFAASRPHIYIAIYVTCLAIAEILTVAGLWFYLRSRRKGFGSLGLWKRATTPGWIFGILLGLLTAGFGLANAALRLKAAPSVLLAPRLWHIYTALVAGLSAGFCEEIMFRGFVMTELSDAGFNSVVQVIASGILFGFLHVGVLKAGMVAGLSVIIPTAILGMIYSLVYLTSKRSLMPSIVSHFINDAVVIPLAMLVAMSSPHL